MLVIFVIRAPDSLSNIFKIKFTWSFFTLIWFRSLWGVGFPDRSIWSTCSHTIHQPFTNSKFSIVSSWPADHIILLQTKSHKGTLKYWSHVKLAHKIHKLIDRMILRYWIKKKAWCHFWSQVKHAQCFDVALMDDGSVVLASKDYRLYIYRYIQVPPIGL